MLSILLRISNQVICVTVMQFLDKFYSLTCFLNELNLPGLLKSVCTSVIMNSNNYATIYLGEKVQYINLHAMFLCLC